MVMTHKTADTLPEVETEVGDEVCSQCFRLGHEHLIKLGTIYGAKARHVPIARFGQ